MVQFLFHKILLKMITSSKPPDLKIEDLENIERNPSIKFLVVSNISKTFVYYIVPNKY